VFQHFHPSMIANYNHDGLAEHFCGNVHAVLDMHGTVEPGYGAPSIAKLVGRLRDVDLPEPTDDLLMGVPESYFSSHPAQRNFRRRLARVAAFAPDFVAIIGYSFAQDDTSYDDCVSLNSFLETRRDFPDRIYIIQPAPDSCARSSPTRFDLKTCSRFEVTGTCARTPSSESYRVETVAARSTTFASKRLTDTAITSRFRLMVHNDGSDRTFATITPQKPNFNTAKRRAIPFPCVLVIPRFRGDPSGKSAVGVRREKAALSSGCKAHPATAPAGSNRSSHGGNEVAEAFG
jgi:hypothetical protein